MRDDSGLERAHRGLRGVALWRGNDTLAGAEKVNGASKLDVAADAAGRRKRRSTFLSDGRRSVGSSAHVREDRRGHTAHRR